jgi:hypothetical protein
MGKSRNLIADLAGDEGRVDVKTFEIDTEV